MCFYTRRGRCPSVPPVPPGEDKTRTPGKIQKECHHLDQNWLIIVLTSRTERHKFIFQKDPFKRSVVFRFSSNTRLIQKKIVQSLKKNLCYFQHGMVRVREQ